MNTIANDPLEMVIRESGEDWLIKWFAPADQALASLRGKLTEANVAARQKFGDDAPIITDASVVELHARDANKARAFLQALGSVESPAMLVMVWRVLAGHSIDSVQMAYESEKDFSLNIVLRHPEQGTEECYISDNIDDVAVLRHLGVMKMGKAPIFDGFYPLNI